MIGNPPYIVYEGNHKGELESIKKKTEFKIALGGKLNAYKLFLAKALYTLTSKNGIITLIFQNSFLADKQAENLRKYIFSNSEFITIDSFPERDNKKKRVFESAKMSVCIVFIRNCFSDSTFYVNFWDDKYKTSGICTSFTPNDIKMIDSSSMTIPRIKKEFKELIIKIKSLKELIKIKCYQGELNMTVHRPYFSMDSSFPKVLKGASIQRYFYTEDMSQGVVEYVNEKKYLKDFRKSEKAYHHESERIAMQGMTGANDKIRLVSTILPSNIYLAHSCNYIISDKSYNLKYILGILNSKIMNWYFRCFSTNSNVNSYEVEQLPIPAATSAQQQKIIVLVDKILATKKQDFSADTGTFESEIDKLVYDLYGLTDEEVKIIEKN